MTEARERRPRGRPSVLSREGILDEAARMPFDKLSVLKLAARLGVSDPAIYYYFPTREALRRALVERWTRGFSVPVRARSWRTWMRQLALNAYQRLGERPGAADFMMYAGPAGLDQLRVMEVALGVLGKAGFKAKDALLVYAAVINLAIDAARQRDAQAAYRRDTGVDSRKIFVRAVEDLPAEQFPQLKAAVAKREGSTVDLETHFQFALEALLRGISGPVRAGVS